MPNSSRQGKIPVFNVRFESYDDFVVEYTDHIRQGWLVLPLEMSEHVGSPVRLKVRLPDGQTAFLEGNAVSAGPVPGGADGEEGTLVKLGTIAAEQREVMEGCISGMAGPAAEQGAVDADEEPLNVLLVDDSISIRVEVAEALRAAGIRVRVAENGLIALSAALKKLPDIILSDVEMPVMDGWTFLRVARQRQRLSHIPIVFFTRLSDDLSRLQGYKMGVDDYLPKSTPPAEIVARLRGVLARRAQGPAAVPETGGGGLRGELQHVGLGSLLSFIESERRTGELTVTQSGDSSVLTVRDGRLQGVQNLGKFKHEHDRVFELLAWTSGEFDFVPGDVPEAADGELCTPISYLLMEHARREDEDAAAAAGIRVRKPG